MTKCWASPRNPRFRLGNVALRRYFMMRVTIVGIKKVRMYKA